MDFNTEIKIATLKNLAAKSKIMAYVFLAILFMQVSSVIFIYCTTNFFAGERLLILILGLILILTAASTEWATYKYLVRMVTQNKPVNSKLSYVITILEISFPTVILLFGAAIMNYFNYDLKQQILSSAPAVLYFLMIILSSLMLDRKLCIVAGAVAALEYSCITFYFLKDSTNFQIDFVTNASKGIVFLFGGFVAGYVSVKIKDSLMDAMKSKDALISKLDSLVKEKTSEITIQKEELEIKNKEIIDSITYASRIQRALITSEKYIARKLREMRPF